MSKLVSIIMPVFNAEKWVGQAIESVQKQTCDNWELIIVNDGSVDGTQKECEKYSKNDSRIKIFSQDNKGPSAARNLGLSKIEGDYFTMIDSDDELCENALESYVQTILHDNSDVVIAGYKMKNVKTNTSQIFSYKEAISIESNGDLNIKVFESVIENGLMASNWNKLYSKRLSHLRFDEEMFMNEDVLFSLSAVSSSKRVSIIPEIAYIYKIQNNDSLSTKFKTGYFESLELIDSILLDKQNDPLLLGIKRWIMDYLFNYLKLCCLRENDKEEKIKKIQEATNCKVFKKYGTLRVANTFNRKLSVLLLKLNAFNLYLKLINRKGQ